MNTPAETPTPTSAARSGARKSSVRRMAAVVIFGVLVVVGLWLAAFSFVTSLLIGSGVVVVIVAADTVSDVASMILDALGAVILFVLAAIAALFAAVFDIFG
ncbi:hypothetical protein [Rhodoplanes sp. Z2-YC6860]|uniref:hypothetical protein n=1 Tax=Rhodoplanes sp. Z2-YC6860 TaxID=674703 RepID=UPI0012ED6E74|nr:hypothetical protein [Rhodoplanes sp. Z2-YC6860]